MAEHDEYPPPVERLDPSAILDEVNRRTDLGLRFIGRATHGEVGAAYVELADGRPAVLTVAGASTAELERTTRLLTRAATAGIPVPRYLAVVDLGERRAVVQQRLPGRAPDLIDFSLVAQLLDLMDRFSGLGEDAEQVNLYLTSSGPSYCLHETLARFDERSRRLLDRIHEIGASGPALEAGDDLVHLDLHPGNLLVDDGLISGIVDWDGIGRGDRRFGLVTLTFDLSFGLRFRPDDKDLHAEALAPVLSGLAAVSLDRVRSWWASMSLRQVDWTIRHHYPRETVDFYLALADRGLNELERGPLTIDTLRTDSNR